jgi:hypothetical protein
VIGKRRSKIAVLLAKSERLKGKLVQIADDLKGARESPGHQRAVRGTLLTPCVAECPACAAVASIYARRHDAINAYKRVLMEITVCTDTMHRKRLRGARHGVAARKAGAQELEGKIREALRRGRWNPRQRGLSKRIATDIGASVRTVQRFLRTLSA